MTDAPIRTTVNNLSAFLAKNLPGSISSTTIQGILSTYNALYSTAALPLTAIQPDYESNVAELQALLNNSSNPAWNQTTPTATGQTLISIVSTAQTYNQFSIERAVHEAFSDFAQLPSSLYTISRTFGVTVAQKQPAQATVTLSLVSALTSSLVIPAYSSIPINGLNYFNRSEIIFAPGVTSLSVTLYQGTVNTVTYYSNGLPSQVYTLNSLDFNISQSDILCTVSGIPYSSTTKTLFYSTGLWEYTANSLVYFQSTDASGNCQIIFGNGNYGQIPSINAPIQFTYVTTLGAAGNIDNSNTTFSFTAPQGTTPITVNGFVNSPNVNGMDERQAKEYAIITPAAFSAKHRPITPSDHNVFALNYPGVIDAKFVNQQTFAPTNLNFMMVMQVALLTSTTWTATDFNNFVTWLENYSIANMQFLQVSLTPVTADITANVYCTDQIPLSTLENLINSALAAAFTPQAGYIGYSIYESDLTDIIKGADPNGNIQYVQFLYPTSDFIIGPYQYLQLGTVNLNMQISNRNNLVV